MHHEHPAINECLRGMASSEQLKAVLVLCHPGAFERSVARPTFSASQRFRQGTSKQMRIDGSLEYFLSNWLVHNSSYRATMVQPHE
jgi:hypothetical protein